MYQVGGIPCPDELISYWNFDDGGTDLFEVCDLTVGSNVDRISGKFKYAYSGFEANAQGSISSGSTNAALALSGQQVHAWEVWLKFSVAGSRDFIALNWDGSENAGWSILYQHEDGLIYWGNNPGGITYNHSAYVDGNWHYLVVTYDGATGKIYIDNVEKASGAIGRNFGYAAGRIGLGLYDYNDTWNWKSSISEVAFWNGAVPSAAIMTARWNGGNGARYSEPLGGFFNFL